MKESSKTCKNCLNVKTLDNFYTQRQIGPLGQVYIYYDSYCKKCRLEYSANRSRSIKIKMIEKLGGKCSNCGIVDDPCIYDFHHADPSKKEIAFGSRGGRSLISMEKELEKCILLCSNCHRKLHKKDDY